MRTFLLLAFLALAPLPLLDTRTCAQEQLAYFPPVSGQWETVDTSDPSWDREKLKQLVKFVGEGNASSLLILHRGRILVENYWELSTAKKLSGSDNWYRYVFRGTNELGHPIEDVSSVQKSVTSLLVGIAASKDLLRIEDTVAKHLGDNWCASLSSRSITIKHLLTMSSGLNQSLEYESSPGSKWAYVNAAYGKLPLLLESATGQPLQQFSQENLTNKIGMVDSEWFRRTGAADTTSNSYGFATSARDLARLGLLVLADGRWNGEQVVPSNYLQAAVATQFRGTAFGFLWWNNQPHLDAQEGLVTSAPHDLIAAMGVFEKRVYVVPSLDLVAVRMGDFERIENRVQIRKEELYPIREFDENFWRLLLAARK